MTFYADIYDYFLDFITYGERSENPERSEGEHFEILVPGCLEIAISA